MYNFPKSPVPATDKQLRCIRIMDNIINNAVLDIDNLDEDEIIKIEEFNKDHAEVERAKKLEKFTLNNARYIISKWQKFSYDINRKYLWVKYDNGNYGDSRDFGLYDESDIFLTEMFY